LQSGTLSPWLIFCTRFSVWLHPGAGKPNSASAARPPSTAPTPGKAPSRVWPGSLLLPGLDMGSCSPKPWLRSRPADPASDDSSHAAKTFALIPVWLRLPLFGALGTSGASAGCARVRLLHGHPTCRHSLVPGAESSTPQREVPDTPVALARHSGLLHNHPPSSRICHPPFAIRHPSFPIPRSAFRIF